MSHEDMFKHKHVPLHSTTLEEDQDHVEKNERYEQLQKEHNQAAIAGRTLEGSPTSVGTKGTGTAPVVNDLPRKQKLFGREKAKDGHPQHGYVLHHSD